MTQWQSPAGGGGGGGGGPVTASIIAAAASLSLTSLDINAPRGILAQSPFAKVFLPAANSSGYTPGPVNFTQVVHPASYPIRLMNAGTEGTDPTLEAVIGPNQQVLENLMQNTSGTLLGSAFSAAAGFWNKQNPITGAMPNTMKMLVPLLPGAQGPRQDLGSTSAFGTNGNGSAPGSAKVAMLSSTLGLMVYIDASANVQAFPFQLSTDGVTNQVIGTKATILLQSGSAVFQYPHIVKTSATTALISWWDSNATRNMFAAVTVVPGTLPAGPTINVGTAIDDTTLLATAGLRISEPGSLGSAMVADNGGPNVWLLGQTGSTNSNRVRAYYLTVTPGTNTVALSASLDYDSGNTVTTGGFVGCSTAAGKILVPGNNAYNLLVLNYSGGAITVAGTIYPGGGATSFFAKSASGTPLARIDAVDLSQGLFVISGSNLNSSFQQIIYSHVKLDLVGYNLLSLRTVAGVTSQDWPDIALAPIYPSYGVSLGDGEVLSINNNGNGSAGNPGLVSMYMDHKTYFRPGVTATAHSTMSEEEIFAQTYQIELTALATTALSTTVPSPSVAVDQPTRRVVIMTIDTAISTLNQGVRFNFFAFPRR